MWHSKAWVSCIWMLLKPFGFVCCVIQNNVTYWRYLKIIVYWTWVFIGKKFSSKFAISWLTPHSVRIFLMIFSIPSNVALLITFPWELTSLKSGFGFNWLFNEYADRESPSSCNFFFFIKKETFHSNYINTDQIQSTGLIFRVFFICYLDWRKMNHIISRIFRYNQLVFPCWQRTQAFCQHRLTSNRI